MLVHHAHLWFSQLPLIWQLPQIWKVRLLLQQGMARAGRQQFFYKGRTVEPMHPETVDMQAGRGLSHALACMYVQPDSAIYSASARNSLDSLTFAENMLTT